ncbi:hypothetical protein MMC26_000343 [Xylographa opegraphella]|nr:hypothetical protein [Xylographa opegraphella]
MSTGSRIREFLFCIAYALQIDALSFSNSSSTITSAVAVSTHSTQTLGPFFDSNTSTFSSTLPQVSGVSSNVSSTYSLVSITSGSGLSNGNGTTEPGYTAGPANMTEPFSPTPKSGNGALPGTAVSIGLKSSTITDFKQCLAAQSSYNGSFAQFTDSVNSAVQAGAYSQSVYASANVITEIIPKYSFSLSVVDTETFSYAWTTVWTTIIKTISISALTTIDTPTFSGTYPLCANTGHTCGGCTIEAASLQLIYWPVSTADGNPSSTILWNGTTPRVGLFSGTPFTSGSVYLKYAAVSAVNSCSVLGGGLRAGPMLTLASNAISSMIGDGTHFTASQSFNYANLNYPYEWAAYTDARADCYPSGRGCQFEVVGGYNPYVSLPQQLRDLDPAWAHCTIAPDSGSWDPPYALDPIEGTLTPPSPIYTQGPMAGATPVSPTVQNTLVSVPTITVNDNLPQPKPWTPLPVPEPTPGNNPVPESPKVDPPASADPSASMNPHPESPLPLPSPQQTQSGSPPTNLVTAQQPTPAPAAQPGPTIPPVITFQGTPITAGTTTAYTIESQTLVPGGPAIIISSATLSLAASATAVAIGSATIPFQPLSPLIPPKITIGNTAYTADSASAFIIGTQTLVPGGPVITNAGTAISLAPSATAIAIGDITLPLQPPNSLAPQITIGPSIYTASLSSFFLVGTRTLQPGGSALTISGTVLSLFPSATALLLAGSTIPLNPPLPTASSGVLTLGTATYTAANNMAGDFVIGTQTLIAGGPALTFSGTVVSLFPSGTALVVAGSTIPLSSPRPTTPPAILTLGTATYTVTTDAAGDLVIGTQTLTPGEVITDAGTILSLEPEGTAAVIGGTLTVPVPGNVVTDPGTETAGVSGAVVSTLGGGITGLGGVVMSEYGATPTGEVGANGGWTASGSGQNRTGGMATGSPSGSEIGEFAGEAARRGGILGSGWGGVLVGAGVGLAVAVGVGGL